MNEKRKRTNAITKKKKKNTHWNIQRQRQYFYHELLCSRNFVWCNVVRYVNVRIEFPDTDFQVEGKNKKAAKQCRLSETETVDCILHL